MITKCPNCQMTFADNAMMRHNCRGKEDLVEKIADFMHDQWSHWMKYQILTKNTTMYRSAGHSNVDSDPYYASDGDEFEVSVIETEDLKRWKRQMNTPYSELSEKEKDSDREWAKKILKLFQDYINKQFPIFNGCIYGDNGCSGYDDGVYACRRHAT